MQIRRISVIRGLCVRRNCNRIVNQYLEFAELQAMEQKRMHMSNWQTKLNAFLTLNDREILNHTGKISHSEAEQHAIAEMKSTNSNCRNR